jgi:hypothetical protein
MSTFRSRTKIFACILPRSSSRKHLIVDDKDTDCSSRNLLVEEEDDCKSYNLETHREGDEATSFPTPNDTPYLPTLSEEEACDDEEQSCISMRSKYGAALSPMPAAMIASDSSSAATTWADLTQSYGDLDLDHEQDGSILSASSITGCSLRSTPTPMSMSAPNSPHPSFYSTSSLQAISPVLSYSSSGAHSYSLPASPVSKPRRPLTTPVRPKSPHCNARHRRSLSASSTASCSSTSSLMLPLTLPALPEPCPQVKTTLTLLKSIKHQIKAMKRRETRLSSQLHVQRRERQQMQEQIAHLEARRLRVEAMFVRPLPLVLLLPVQGHEEEYDLCLLSEGSDSWNALPPLIRIELIQSPSTSGRNISSRGRGAALLIHFGPTLTQPMAAALSFVQNPSMDALQPGSGTMADLVCMDLQPLVKRRDPAFWERVTCGQVLEADKFNQLEDVSCQFLFDALLRDLQHLWRHQLTQVVDKNTRRIQWILPQEADALYYDAIPAASPAQLPPLPPPLALLPPLPPPSGTSLTAYLTATTSDEIVL